jgi:hypothetical protein
MFRLLRFATVAVFLASCGVLSMPQAQAAAQNTQTKCVYDSSLSIRLCLTIEWNDLYTGGSHYVEMVDVYAKTYNSLGNVVYQVQAGAVVLGRCYSGCSGTEYDGQSLRIVNYPVYGRNYGGAPAWSRDFTQVGGINYSCGVAESRWRHGSGDQTPLTMDLCVGLNPDSLTLSDRERGLA